MASLVDTNGLAAYHDELMTTLAARTGGGTSSDVEEDFMQYMRQFARANGYWFDDSKTTLVSKDYAYVNESPTFSGYYAYAELPNVSIMASHAFDYNGVTYLSLPNLKSIPRHAFNRMYYITSLCAPNVTHMDSEPFYMTAFAHLYLPNCITMDTPFTFTHPSVMYYNYRVFSNGGFYTSNGSTRLSFVRQLHIPKLEHLTGALAYGTACTTFSTITYMPHFSYLSLGIYEITSGVFGYWNRPKLDANFSYSWIFSRASYVGSYGLYNCQVPNIYLPSVKDVYKAAFALSGKITYGGTAAQEGLGTYVDASAGTNATSYNWWTSNSSAFIRNVYLNSSVKVSNHAGSELLDLGYSSESNMVSACRFMVPSSLYSEYMSDPAWNIFNISSTSVYDTLTF